MIKFYVACPMDRVDMAKAYADRLRILGYEVVSRWHDIVIAGDSDPNDWTHRRAVIAANYADMDAADAVFAYTAHGTPKCTWGEVGYAHAKGKPVLMHIAAYGDGPRCVLDAGPRTWTFADGQYFNAALANMISNEFDAYDVDRQEVAKDE